MSTPYLCRVLGAEALAKLDEREITILRGCVDAELTSNPEIIKIVQRQLKPSFEALAKRPTKR